MNADPDALTDRLLRLVRRSPLALAAALALVLLAVLVAVNAAPTGNLHTGDTDLVVQGARTALHCLDHHQFTRCGLTSADRTDVGPYPLLQYLPAAFLAKLSSSNDHVVRGLGRLNFLVFLFGLAGAWLAVRRKASPPIRTLVMLTLILSPLWYYSTAGFGEMLSVITLVGVVLAVVERRPVLILAMVILAGISKETLPYFAASLGLLVGLRTTDRWLPPRRVLIPLASGMVVAVGVNTVFNEFRYGQASNPFYLQSTFRVHQTGQVARDYLAVVFSPNAGIIAFWPVLLIPAVLGIAALVSVVRRDGWPQRVRWMALLAWPAVFVGTAAVWFAPFGWIAWGPRLEVPVLPAWAIAVMLSLPSNISDWLAAITTKTAVVVVGAVCVILLAIVPGASAWSYADGINRLIEADTTCPAMTQVAIEKNRSQYFSCLSHFAWRDPGAVLYHSADPPSTLALLGQIALGLAAVALVLDSRRVGASDDPPDQHRDRSPAVAAS